MPGRRAHRQQKEDVIEHLHGLDEHLQLTHLERKLVRSLLQELHLSVMQDDEDKNAERYYKI
jgi:hypothetical protein